MPLEHATQLLLDIIGGEADELIGAAGLLPDEDQAGAFIPIHLNGRSRISDGPGGVNRLIVMEVNGQLASVMPLVMVGSTEVVSSVIDRRYLQDGMNALAAYWTEADQMTDRLFRQVKIAAQGIGTSAVLEFPYAEPDRDE